MKVNKESVFLVQFVSFVFRLTLKIEKVEIKTKPKPKLNVVKTSAFYSLTLSHCSFHLLTIRIWKAMHSFG